MHEVDLNLLRVLDALLETRSVTGAARRLNLSQPAASRVLGRIRRAVGDPVLVRSGHSMQATPWAEQVREEVRAGHSSWPAWTAPSRSWPTTRTSPRSAHGWWPSVRRAAPRVRMRFTAEAPHDDQALRDGTADLSVTTYRGVRGGLRCEHLGYDHHVAVMGAAHPLAAGPLTLTAFAEAGHVVASRRGRFRGPIDEALASHGLRRDVIASAPSFAAMMPMLNDHELVGTIPRAQYGATAAALGLVTKPLPIRLPRIHLGQYWHTRNDSDQAHQWLRTLIRQAAVATLDSG